MKEKEYTFDASYQPQVRAKSDTRSLMLDVLIALLPAMGLASAICWVVNEYILMKLGLGFMQTLTYILVIAVLVQFVEMFLKKSVPSLYSALGIYLPLITTNCAVLGVVLLNTQNNYNFLESTVYGITGGMGTTGTKDSR